MRALREHNFKIYFIIIFASLFVVLLGVKNYEDAKAQITALADKNKIAASENIVGNFSFWLGERLHSLLRAAKFMQNAGISQDSEKLGAFIRLFKENSAEFDALQFLREDGEIFVDGKELEGDEAMPKSLRTGLVWFEETKNTLAPTVNFMQRHKILGEPTLNLCVPVMDDGSFAGVFCGVVKLQNILKNMEKFKLAPDSYAFIVTHGGEILTPMKDAALKKQIEDKFKELFLRDEDITSIKIGSNFISVAEIPTLNWFIGAGTDNEKELAALLNSALKNALILLFAFAALALVANFLHNFMYSKIKNLQDDYEALLKHKARMSEAGELISGINHQFIQPVNSLNLMISSLLMLQKDGKLDAATLESMLQKGRAATVLLSDTIEIFRNFYKTSDSPQKFSVQRCIKDLLKLMHTELSKANVTVSLREFKDEEATQRMGIVQQILLILIHNAKDAVVERYKEEIAKRQIFIEVKFENGMCKISVTDYGSGVSKELRDKILTQPKTTKKQGSGIGLYFGKKLANEKLAGDIRLLSAGDPTTFELGFEINLKE